MTCIAGYVADGAVYMGGDSASTNGGDLIVRQDRKVFRRDDWLCGFCGSYRAGQLLRHTFKAPPRPVRMDATSYLVERFIEAVRECFREGGVASLAEDSTELGHAFLIGYAGHLYFVDADYQVCEAQLPFFAVGSGGPYALGALDALQHSALDVPQRINAALTAAERWCALVRSPFHVEVLPPPPARRRRSKT